MQAAGALGAAANRVNTAPCVSSPCDWANAVAAGVIEGLSNTQIASRRDVSPETIKTQVANVFAKAGVANRYEFLRLALRVDLPVESAEEPKR